ncbi:Trihelix transcription factor asil2 [Thalictrum thalictroides]|uniref:Trihelix transcription factor asil2 n=1 Tax=Thalictrum thalictroides TaxID=46969 RepID=A0A7J6V1R6_THATH|nr:Trihelix transcription factor asil2 [Thalictrum thalictroides]
MNTPSTKTLMPLKRPSTLQTHREDCWSEEDSCTLVEAWGDRYIELNHGNLRQKHWQQVADTVNSYRKIPRTDIQCKNRIDTLKKRYKLERSKILASNGKLNSNWPLYNRLHSLIGDFTTSKGVKKLKKCSKRAEFVALPLPTLPRQKGLEVKVYGDDFYTRRFGEVGSRSRLSSESREGDGEEVDGMRGLAKAIMRFGEVYERVEGEKQMQMIELEKQRMEVTKSMEFERMQLFMDTLVQVEKIKRSKRASAASASDNYN